MNSRTKPDPAVVRAPWLLFGRWYTQACTSEHPGWLDCSAMHLSTVSATGVPSSRVVLCRGYGREGIRFFTCYTSRKGRELDATGLASIVFYWPHLARQVRIEGKVSRLTCSESDAYFASRPRSHQIGAWASLQSRPLRSRHDLEQRRMLYEQRFATMCVPRPRRWGGYLLVPKAWEFWQQRDGRLHDRVRYDTRGGKWSGRRLNP